MYGESFDALFADIVFAVSFRWTTPVPLGLNVFVFDIITTYYTFWHVFCLMVEIDICMAFAYNILAYLTRNTVDAVIVITRTYIAPEVHYVFLSTVNLLST